MNKRFWAAFISAALLLTSLPVRAEEETEHPEEVEVTESTVSDGDAETPVDLSGKMINLALIVDTTGSMGGYIDDVRANLTDFVNYIRSTGAQFRISLIDYKDITCDEPTVVHRFDYSVWSENADQMISEIETLWADGGGDFEETVVDGLGYVLDDSVMTFNSDAAKFAIIVTDASYKVDNVHGYTSMDEVIDRLSEKGIRVSVMTDTDLYDVYGSLTDRTGGILCPIDGSMEVLKEYADAIIRATADTVEDDSILSVKSISVDGQGTIRPGYLYEYRVSFEPENATDKGVFWYVNDAGVAEVVTTRGTKCYVRGISEGTTTLTAVSRDGGYTYSFEIKVSNEAEASGSYLTDDLDTLKAVLGDDSIKNVEYRLVGTTDVDTSQQAEMFSAIQGNEKDLTFAFADGSKSIQYTWTFSGNDLRDASIGISNFGIQVASSDTEALSRVDEDATDALDVQFAHEGELPGRALIELPVSGYAEGTGLNLYYYNAEKGAFELTAEGIIVTEGYVVFPIDHCSNYIITAHLLRNLVPVSSEENQQEEEEIQEEVQAEQEPVVENVTVVASSPKTGERAGKVWQILLPLGAFGIFGIIRTMKKIRNK